MTRAALQIAPDSAEEEAKLTTGDMARLSQSTLRTVRFYEQEGLIKPKARSGGGRRLFAKAELHKLQLALDLREAGLSIQDIKELFELKTRFSTPQEASIEITAILGRQINAMQEKIAKLRRLREELASMVSVISECQSCDDTSRFPTRCHDCDVLDQPELPRAVTVLWS
ncbi:MAG: MerR family transcriptional regulator [Myxococcota bacterium]